MIIHNPILTGSFTVNGTDVASITGSAASITALNSYTASQNILNGTYATTSSNTFTGIQTVNSNLVVTGSITAQTLVVQTVTSSIVYSSGSNIFGNSQSNTQTFTGSVLMTGSVGINQLIPSYSLDVNGITRMWDGTQGLFVRAYTGGAGFGAIYSTGVTAGAGNFALAASSGTTILNAPSGGSVALAVNSAQKLIVDASGNLGLGVTPSAWESGYTVLQQNTKYFNAADGSANYQGINAYYNSGWKYVASGTAQYLQQYNGGFTFFNAASGTAGAAITWATLLNIASTGAATFSSSVTAGSSGQVFLTGNAGTSSIGMRFTNSGGNSFIGLSNSGGTGYLSGTAYAFNIQTEGAQDLQLGTNNVNRLLIKSGGNVLIGTTDDASYKLQVQGTFRATGAITQFASTGYYVDMNYIGSTYNFGSGETTDNVDFKVAGGGTFTTGGNFRWFTQAGGSTPLERMRITSAGDIYIGSSTINKDSRLVVYGSTTDGFNYAIRCYSVGSDILFGARNDGAIITGTSASSPYNLVRSGRVMMVDSGGVVGYQSSTRQSKTNINNLTDISFLYQLNPVSFNYRKTEEISNTFTDEYNEDLHYGLIADEVETVNKELVFYNEKNGQKEVAGVEYGKLTAVLVKAIQELKVQNDDLQAQITELKNK